MIIVIVFDLPDKIRLMRESMLIQAASHIEQTIYSVVVNGISAIVLTFVAILVLHLLVRILWVGILGLRTIHDHPSLDKSADRMNRLASHLFALWMVSAWLTSLMIGSIIGLLPVTLYVSGYNTSWSLLLLLPSYTLGCWGLMKMEFGFGVATMQYIPSFNVFKLRKSKWPGTLEAILDAMLLWKTVQPVFELLEKTLRGTSAFRIFFSVLGTDKGWRYPCTIYTAFILTFIGITGNYLTLELLTLENVTHASLVSYDSYESMITTENVSRITSPTIPTQIIETTSLKVFIPVLSGDQAVLKERYNPWVLYENILSNQKPISFERRAQLLQWSLQCTAALFDIVIDDSIRVAPRFFHHIHPHHEEYGLICFVDISDIAPGVHILHVRRMYDVEGGEKNLVARQNYSIPFIKE